VAVQPDWEESLAKALRRPAFQELIAKAQG
jgi:hypothetical protein